MNDMLKEKLKNARKLTQEELEKISGGVPEAQGVGNCPKCGAVGPDVFVMWYDEERPETGVEFVCNVCGYEKTESWY